MLTVVLGGARSGKSRYAQSLCDAGPVVYIATAVPGDDADMKRRIAKHQEMRPAAWTTVEEPLNIAEAVTAASLGAAVIVDCVTIWLSNALWVHRNLNADALEEAVLHAVDGLIAATVRRDVIAVSNEVGSGTIPEHPVSRSFRDLQGFVNQRLAREANRVVLVVAGLPLILKDTTDTVVN